MPTLEKVGRIWSLFVSESNNLINVNAHALPKADEYAQDYSAELKKIVLDQYKICIEMADRISARRLIASNMYITICSALVVVFGIGPEKFGSASPYALRILILILLFIVSMLWLISIIYYRDLNSAKYAVINEIEKFLPRSPFTDEWILFKQMRNSRLGIWKGTLSNAETIIPISIMLLSFCCAIFIVLTS